VVDFFVPGVDEARKIEIGRFYNNLYERLYDEDAIMMAERQVQLDTFCAHQANNVPPMVLGSLAELRGRLPITIDSGGRKFCIVENGGELVAYSTVCPHLLGPLGESKVRDGIIECPWHGYRYNIRTRKCVSGANFSLAIAPRVRIDTDSCVILEFH
jgi:nitrite reductase/ring-hydroxylating ferredoxin subunit